MRYNLKFAEALHKTDIGLDGIIEALGGEPPEPPVPPFPDHPETKVWYEDGSISSFEIEGELGQNSIPNKEDVVKVEIGNTVTDIKKYAFETCNKMSSITIPTSITNIANRAFYSCSGLLSINIPNSITVIKTGVFCNCYQLESVIIPNSITSIGNEAFYNCYQLESVIIPNSITSIGSETFYNCPATVTFEGKGKATVQGMTNFRWSIGTNKIICTDGTL